MSYNDDNYGRQGGRGDYGDDGNQGRGDYGNQGRGDYGDNRRGDDDNRRGDYGDNRRGDDNNRRGDYGDNRRGDDNDRRGGYGDNRRGDDDNRRGDYGDNRRDDDNERRGEGHGHSSGTSYGGGGYGGGEDISGAAEHANRHSGDSGDSNMFSNILGSLSGKQQHLKNEDVDEDDAVRQHQKFYGGGSNNEPASEGNIGSAAAMQALKMFGQGGSGNKNEFIGMAMGQAAQLFEQQSANGNTHSGATKEGAVAQAAQMAMKMYFKSEMGGSGGIMGLASKFM